MVKTASTMLKLGSQLEGFHLLEPKTKNRVALSDASGGVDAYLVLFICNHCPFVVHIADKLAQVCNQWHSMGVAVYAINSNDVERYPEDDPSKMVDFANRYGFKFPYLFDPDQTVARQFDAACTPDFFLLNAQRRLVYRGQFDDSRPGNDAVVTGADLSRAVEELLAGKQVSGDQKPSLGCNIKWKPGNEPAYF
ncbi:MAG: thioredoxin family protein [Zetaproteobacteria bacterium]|nr:thioredoxin family protein [Zetaproteobacteria bacterium]